MLTIRPLTSNDSTVLMTIATEFMDYEKELFPLRKSGQEFAPKMVETLIHDTQNGEVTAFVAEMDGTVVGYIAAHPEGNECDTFDTFYVEDLAVLSTYRGQGIGTALLQHTQKYAKDKGYRRFGVGVLHNNTNALNLYKKLGFDVYGIEMIKEI